MGQGLEPTKTTVLKFVETALFLIEVGSVELGVPLTHLYCLIDPPTISLSAIREETGIFHRSNVKLQ